MQGGDAVFEAPVYGDFFAGLRVCPNADCRALIYVAYPAGPSGQLLAMFPQEVLEFDPSGLPDKVLAAFGEAVTCHAHGAWTAAAMMVRKTLEDLCLDRGAEGATLFKRMEALRDQATLPPALLDGLDALRLLGNDAAHVESRAYEQVGKEEIEVGIAVAQEILKATYQMDSIVGRLKGLQRRPEIGASL
jgi:hypothetical protein